jgi:SSS family transporter
MNSTITYLSYPGEMVKYGPVFLCGVLGYPVAAWVVGRFIIPRIRQFNVTSGYEILELRLGKGSRLLATLFFISLRFMWMSTIVFATVRVALLPILGLSEAWVPVLCAGIILFTVFFTTIGGLRAVVATDALQSIIMFVGALVTIAVILFSIGNVPATLKDPSLYSGWIDWVWAPKRGVRMTAFNICLMNMLWQICTAGSDQMAIQRYLSVKDTKSAAHSFNISLLSSGTIILLLGTVGLMVMAYFFRNPQWLPAGQDIHSASDILFPTFIRIGLPVGVTGLIAAALLAAAISSLSSGLNSVSSVIVEDVLKRLPAYKGREFSLRTNKWISAALGLLVLGSSFLVGYVQGNMLDISMKVVNLVTAPLFVLFFLALFCPRANDPGAVIGGLAALAAAIGVSFFGLLGFVQTWNLFAALTVGIPVGIAASYLCSRDKVS